MNMENLREELDSIREQDSKGRNTSGRKQDSKWWTRVYLESWTPSGEQDSIWLARFWVGNKTPSSELCFILGARLHVESTTPRGEKNSKNGSILNVESKSKGGKLHLGGKIPSGGLGFIYEALSFLSCFF